MKTEKEKDEFLGAHKFGMWSNTLFMVKRAWKECPSVLGYIVALVTCMLLRNLLQLFVVPVILDKVEGHVLLSELVWTILFFSIGLVITGAVIAYVNSNTLFGRVTVRSNLIMDIHDKVNLTSYSNLQQQKFIKLQEKAAEVTDSNQEATEAIWNTLQKLILNLIGFSIYAALLSNANCYLMLLSFFSALLGYLVNLYVYKWQKRKLEKRLEYFNKLAYINRKTRDEFFAKDVRVFGMKKWLQDLHEHFVRKLQKYYNRRGRVFFGRDLIELILNFLLSGVSYGYLIAQVLKGNMNAAEFLLYFGAVTEFHTWVNGILTEFAMLYNHSLDISRVREFLEYEEKFAFEEGMSLEPQKGRKYELELRNVSFRYHGAEKDTLCGINLKIAKGEKLAIVGLNGAGKTTLVKILCGLYDPMEGTVLLDGQDIKQYNRRDYYRHFSAVFQNFSLLAGTIAENVAQSDTDIDLEKVKSCVVRAGLKEKLESLPKLYDTHLNRDVFEDAVELSGGEIQKLMLARALYKEAPIMILDEPTAALDPLAESAMYERYHEWTKDCTSVYISHRLASTRFCDRVILIGNGKILEEGTHESLLAAGGEYAHLFEIQSHYYKKGEEQNEEEK